jgi:hypothetical protein
MPDGYAMNMGKIVPTEIARAIAAQRETVTSTCQVCSATIIGLKTRRYCSNRCRQRAYYAKHTDEQRERMRQRTQQRRLGTDRDSAAPADAEPSDRKQPTLPPDEP